MSNRVTPIWLARRKLGSQKLVLAQQVLVPGVREPAHILRWGRSGLTICGEPSAYWLRGTGNAAHMCRTCWRIFLWSQSKSKPACRRCGLEFPWYEQPTDLCAYCAHVEVSQYGKDV